MKTTSTISRLAAVLSILAAGPAAALGQMTVNEAVIHALQSDPTVRKVIADTTEAQAFARKTKADFMPQLTLDARGGVAYRDRSIDGVSSGGDALFSRSAGLVGRQLLTDFGYTWWRWQDAKKRVCAQEFLDNAQRELTAWYAIEAYVDVIRDRRQVELARKNLEVHERVLDLAAKRAEAAGNKADIELSSARRNLASTLVRERELALSQSEANFTRWVGRKPPGSLVMPKVRHFNAVSDIRPEQNFHYRAVTHQLEAAHYIKRALQRKYYPKIYFEGAAQIGQDVLGIEGEDNAASAMIVISWDIFDGGRRKAEIAEAMADIDRQTAILDETLVILRQDIAARWADYRTLSERMGIIRNYSAELARTVGLYQEQFDLGTRPLLSLLDIQNEVSAADIRLVDYQRNQVLLGYRLLFFGGRLVTETAGAQHLNPTSCETLEAGASAKNPVWSVAKNPVWSDRPPPPEAMVAERRQPARGRPGLLNKWFGKKKASDVSP